ncbi:sulfite exporter TauE/SafE family protein [Endozoicomonas sp. SM1973]|uniref:Probable membrane transporter protein n=1 Tax=Spartinivicinus marinus TaxID=2994442 RepID=A0A853IHR4_9GAMM|nr:sulfite exporter TauE/SafE family protein [Spartinivicinus marinus]MCX4025849.1 sulfite exporter TauE/SafE family protein [Spartinivicinus marinus]NYZ68665.1 sulfite exporter TauE/SafE family protein [Spartinivicinus marinus]
MLFCTTSSGVDRLEVIDLSITTLVLLALVAFVASLTSTVTGMGGGMLLFAAMNTVIPLRPLVALHGIVQFGNNLIRIYFLLTSIRWRIVIPFCVGALVGTIACVIVVEQLVNESIPLFILLILITYTVFKPKKLPNLVIKDCNFLYVGVATGIIGILVGAIDPLLAVFFVRDDFSKEEIVANKSAMQCFTHLLKIPAYMYLGFSFLDHLEIILLLLAACAAGNYLGIKMLQKINKQLFFLLLKLVLLIAGIRLSYQLVMSIS